MTNKKANEEYKKDTVSMKGTKMGKEISATVKKPSPMQPKKHWKITNIILGYCDEAKVILKNLFEFVETASLLIVTGFAIYGSLHYEMRNEYKYSVLFSGVVVGLIAMNLLRKFLARR